jgi:hypothetical protein
MIEVKLTFTSIAAAVAALASIDPQNLVGTPVAASAVSAPEKAAQQAKPAKPAKAETPPPAAAPFAPAAPSVDYPTLQKAVFKLAGTPGEATTADGSASTVGRVACGELLAELGVPTFKELPADRWADALKLVLAKTSELQNAVA